MEATLTRQMPAPTADAFAPLDDLQLEHVGYLLSLWHAWSRASSRASRGYARTSPGFESYRCSRQYDDANGALDDAADTELARAVDGVIARLPDPWRTALHVEARNIDASARVWTSARLAAYDVERCTSEAKSLLWAGLVRANLV